MTTKYNLEKVLVFVDEQEMWQQIGQDIHSTNLNTRKVTGQIYKKQLLEYKMNSDRWLKAQEKRDEERKKSGLPPSNPNLIGLTEEEYNEFNEQHFDLSKDQELTTLISLYAIGEGYNYDNANRSDLPFSFGGHGRDYNMTSLVSDIKDTLSHIGKEHFGVKLVPVFYTTQVDEPLVPESVSNSEESLKDRADLLTDIAKSLGYSLSPEEKEEVIDNIKKSISSNERFRGLNDEERQEFEKLYFQNDNLEEKKWPKKQ